MQHLPCFLGQNWPGNNSAGGGGGGAKKVLLLNEEKCPKLKDGDEG